MSRPPSLISSTADPLERVARFGRALRAEGVPVGTDRLIEFCRAGAILAPDDLYWAGRTTLVARPEHFPAYDRLYIAFFGGEATVPAPPVRAAVRLRPIGDSEDAGEGCGRSGNSGAAAASRLEVLRHKSFAHCSPQELAELREMMARIRVTMPLRRSRRREAARAGSLDLRQTLRRSLHTGGEPLERSWRTRRRRRRRLVLVVDVSGSMASYSRALVMFAHAAVRADATWETFCFGTRLTRVTRALAVADADEALARAAEDVFDWDGGTRIGESLKEFLDRFGHGGLARGAVVAICSDGLDVGDPLILSEQMARLGRLARSVIWLNPLKGDPAYEPLARGMEAALPYVDTFMSGHNLASLEELAAHLKRMP